MVCRIDASLCKTPDEVKLKGFDYTLFLTLFWLPGTVYSENEVVRPPAATGFQYRALNTGQTSSRKPAFPFFVGEIVTDGSIDWVTELIDNNSLRTAIASSSWSASDPAITFANEAIDNIDGRQRTSASIGGGVLGGEYIVINTVTMDDGSVEEMGIALEVTEESEE